jgi:hypothetical protein
MNTYVKFSKVASASHNVPLQVCIFGTQRSLERRHMLGTSCSTRYPKHIIVDIIITTPRILIVICDNVWCNHVHGSKSRAISIKNSIQRNRKCDEDEHIGHQISPCP